MVSGVEGVFCREVNTPLGKKIVIKTHDRREYAAPIGEWEIIDDNWRSFYLNIDDYLKAREAERSWLDHFKDADSNSNLRQFSFAEFMCDQIQKETHAAKVNDFIEKKLDKAIDNIYPSISIDFKDCLKKRITRINFADRPEYFEFYLDYSGDVKSSKRLGGYEIKYSYKFEGQSVSCDIEYIWHE